MLGSCQGYHFACHPARETVLQLQPVTGQITVPGLITGPPAAVYTKSKAAAWFVLPTALAEDSVAAVVTTTLAAAGSKA